MFYAFCIVISLTSFELMISFLSLCLFFYTHRDTDTHTHTLLLFALVYNENYSMHF